MPGTGRALMSEPGRMTVGSPGIPSLDATAAARVPGVATVSAPSTIRRGPANERSTTGPDGRGRPNRREENRRDPGRAKATEPPAAGVEGPSAGPATAESAGPGEGVGATRRVSADIEVLGPSAAAAEGAGPAGAGPVGAALAGWVGPAS